MKTRKINRAKQHSSSCKNNGGCAWCRNSRTFSNRKREPIVAPNETTISTQEVDGD